MKRALDFSRRFLPVRREERQLVIVLYSLLTVMVLSDWVGKVGADSLFVKRFGIQYIPAMYIVTPLAMLATSALLFAVIDRMPRRTLLLSYVTVVMFASIAIQAALPLGGLLFPIAYVFAHGVKETIYLLFWVYAGNLYDSEQAKRLFPLFAGAVLVGKILGGVVATALADLIHAENFMGAQAVGFFVCLVLIFVYRNRLPEGREQAGAPRDRAESLGASLRSSLEGYRAVTTDQLMRVLGVGVFLWYLLMQTGNYLYLLGLDASSTLATAQRSEDAFSQLYASVYTSGSLVALAIQTLLTTMLLRRLGVGLALFIFPLWYLGSFASALVTFNFLTAVSIQLGERVVVPAIHRPTTELVYSQVSANIRPRARTFLSGGINALGNLAAAVVLLASAATGVASATILALASVLSLLFVANAWSLRRSLGRRIAENLASEDDELRRNALQMLPGEGAALPIGALRALLFKPLRGVEPGIGLRLRIETRASSRANGK